LLTNVLLAASGLNSALWSKRAGRPLGLHERTRTLLALGIRRRRSRKRADARTAPREALIYFETAGALPWAGQARVELRAAGETMAPEGLRKVAGLS
jgi:hypothetical protein